MEQQCVYFHTEKEFSIANEILETDGVEILFTAKSAEIPMSSLTVEEKDAWNDSLLENIVSVPEFGRRIKSLEIGISYMQEERNLLLELQKQFHKDPHDKTALQALKRSLMRSSGRDRNRNRFPSSELFDMNEMVQDTVKCSCIIGKKDGNMIRYIEFLENKDPIVTISGPNALELKPRLEQKF